MKFDDAQKQQISQWISEGAKLSEIQNRIASEFGVAMTYMDVRLLVDDLKLVPKDQARPKDEKPSVLTAPGPGEAQAPHVPVAGATPAEAKSDGVSVVVDRVARPGTLASGAVKFTDGQTGVWYLDEQGRLGVAPAQKGYKPNAGDMESFQRKLEVELSRLGY